MGAFFHLYNLLLQNGHLQKPIAILERVIEIFNDDWFGGGGQRTIKTFLNSFKLCIDIQAQYLGDDTKLWRRKGQTQRETFIFRDKGKPNDHSLYTKQGRLFALSQTNWLFSEVDPTQFPSLASPIHSASEILDFLKSDLTGDITGRTPVATLNHNLLLRTVLVIFCELDNVKNDMPEAKAMLSEFLDKAMTTAPGRKVKILSLALSYPTVTSQDVRNERLDSPILAPMGFHLSKMWDKLGPELEPSLVYGTGLRKTPEDLLVDEKLRTGRILGKGTQGGEFLRSKKIQELREVSPKIYEALVAGTTSMKVGSSADCEYCRKGVQMHNTDEYVSPYP